MARPKASVLPEPVWPRPNMSRPAIASGSVAVWMGNGAVIPADFNAGRMAECTPRSLNDTGYPYRNMMRVSIDIRD